MAKSRKIDVAFFDQAWVVALVCAGRPDLVLLFIYLVVTCQNNVGVFEVNPILWNYRLNPRRPFTADDPFTSFGNRIRRIKGHPDKGIILQFCDYQRNFSQYSSQWQWVVKDLDGVGLTYDDLLALQKDAPTQPELDLGLPPPAAETVEPKARKARAKIPPAIEDVRAYCAERANGVDAQAFIDFYASKGWKVGNQPMRDWQAAVRTWEKRDGRGTATKPATAASTPTDAAVRRMF